MSTLAHSLESFRRVSLPRRLGIAAIVAALFGLWLVLPPAMTGTVAVPAAFGAVAVAVGAWVVREGEPKIGYGAIVAGVFAITMGYVATKTSTGNLKSVVDWGVLISTMFIFATPLTYAALGGLFAERSGVINIGLEGMMLMGAFFGILGSDKLSSWPLGLLVALGSGGLMALVYAFFAIHLRADQVVGGTAINFLALGITGYFYIKIYGQNGTPGTGIPSIPDFNWLGVHVLRHIPPGHFWENAFGHLNLMVWLMLALLLVTYFVVFRTSIGLRIRAVGEHPRAADTVGLSVYKIRYSSVVVSGMLAAAGGAYLSAFTQSFAENLTAGRGFIGLAALIFGNWRPFGAFGAACLFGFSFALALRIQDTFSNAPEVILLNAIPYVLTLIAVAGVIGRSIPPAASGRPYVKQ
jgi:simple sugar transport system permease protein